MTQESSARARSTSVFAEPHQRVDAERLDRPALDQFGAAVGARPFSEPRERKLRPQSETARRLGREPFQRGANAALGIKMIDKNDLAARLDDAGAFVEHALGLLDQRDDELGDDAIEARLGKGEIVASMTMTALMCG